MEKFDFGYWSMLEPMKYYDKADDNSLSANLLTKKYMMIDNFNNEFIATQKWDGEWTMFIKDGDKVLVRSRSLSKVTGVYGDKTLHVPHITKEMEKWPDGSVVLGELCWGIMGTVSTDVGTILRCLPDKAVARQANQKLIVKVFDVLCWNGERLDHKGYGDRLGIDVYLFSDNQGYFTPTKVFTENFQAYADEIIRAGGEGIVIQRRDYPYEPGKRSAWKTLKLKQRLEDMTLKVVATKDPTKEYQGKDEFSWNYWEGIRPDGSVIMLNHYPTDIEKLNGAKYRPVSKAYFYGWKMGITCNFNGILVDASSGLTDEDREWLATDEAQTYIKNGQLYAEIRSMMVASLGGLRHPVIHKLRILDDQMHDGLVDIPIYKTGE